MSSTLKPLTLGRRPEDGQDRAAMLSRLGIAQSPTNEPPEAQEPEPAAQVEALAAPPPEPVEEIPQISPALMRLRALVKPANDEQLEPAAAKPAFDIPAPPEAEEQPQPQAEVEEDPFEAIREKYRNPPKPTLQLPGNIPLPTSLPSMPKVPLKIAPVGERRRKAGELSGVRKVIWGLSTLAALAIGWALLKGDESSAIVQMFGVLLP